MRFTFAFGFLGIILLALAIRQAGQVSGFWWVGVIVEIEVATCFLTLAAIYGMKARDLNVASFLLRPVWSTLIRLILVPYLMVGVITMFVSRWFDREGLLNPLAPGLWVGRLPFPPEREQVRAAGVEAVLNLCWEFPRLSKLDRIAGIETVRIPILDGSAPLDRQFREAVQQVERWRSEGRCVFIHCAQGHGRTATIAAAVLIELGLAPDVEGALEMIEKARPLARPSHLQRSALARFVSQR